MLADQELTDWIEGLSEDLVRITEFVDWIQESHELQKETITRLAQKNNELRMKLREAYK